MPPRGVSKLIAGADGLGFSATDGGLRPPPPISVEPSGIPTGPTDEPAPIDEAKGGDAVADAAQVPGAIALMPPPSKGEEPDNPGSSHRTCHGIRRGRRRSAGACRTDQGRRAGCGRAHARGCEFGRAHGNSSVPDGRIGNAKRRGHAKRREGGHVHGGLRIGIAATQKDCRRRHRNACQHGVRPHLDLGPAASRPPPPAAGNVIPAPQRHFAWIAAPCSILPLGR